MNKRLFVLFALCGLSFIGSGCHHLSNDFNKYVASNPVLMSSQKTSTETNYYLTEGTKNHIYKFRLFASGIANSWIVEFGKMLEMTLQSRSVQDAFGKLTRVDSESSEGNLLIFDLQKYEFDDFNAHITLKVTFMKNSKPALDKVYYADGRAQAGKMIWGGAMSTKNAVQQSTRYALTQILSELLNDLNALNHG